MQEQCSGISLTYFIFPEQRISRVDNPHLLIKAMMSSALMMVPEAKVRCIHNIQSGKVEDKAKKVQKNSNQGVRGWTRKCCSS